MGLWFATLVAFTVVELLGTSLGKPAQQPPPDAASAFEQMVEARQKTSQPGAAHLGLMKLAGEYSVKNTVYRPGQTVPTVTDGAATIKNELGERFLVEHNEGAIGG